MLNTWFDQALRNAQPVLVVVGCLCLCLGSCFPSSEPLNRIPATQSYTQEMVLEGETVQTIDGTDMVTAVSNKVFSKLNIDPRFRNMDTVVQDRLDSVGQIPFSSTSATIVVNSTRGAINPLPSSSSSSSKSDRHRQRPNLNKKKNKSTREQSHLIHKSKSRSSKKRRLSSERRGKTRQNSGLDPRAGRRNKRMQRFDCSRLRSNTQMRQLENSLSLFLAVYSDGAVNGTAYRRDMHTLLSIVAYRWGLIRIYGEAARRFVCMNRTGEVYSAETSSRDCLFYEERHEQNLMNTYSLYSPKKTVKWYLGISKKGVVKNGRRVRKVLKIAHFLPALPPDEIDC